jgi:hypothetical protein
MKRFIPLLLLLLGVVTNASAQAPPFEGFQDVWFGGMKIYHDGEYLHRFLVIEKGKGFELAQVDFFPPEANPPCVWIESDLRPYIYNLPTTDMPMLYCGGIGWRHLVVEPNFDGWWYVWTLRIREFGGEWVDTLIFYVRK